MNPSILNQMLIKYQTEIIPQMGRWKSYYDGKQDILLRQYKDVTKPCCRTITNFCKNVTDIYTGYIAAPNCISYQSEQDITLIQQVLNYNDAASEDAEFLRNALICGFGAELMYIDQDKKIRFSAINPMTCFGIYSDDLTDELLYFVTWSKENDWDFDNQVYNLDLYDNVNVTHYRMVGMGGPLELIGSERHFFNQCPANIFYIQDEKSIFDCIMSLQDSYNETLSNQTEEISQLSNSYMVLTGNFDVQDFKENLPSMRENRTIILGEGCTASWLIKDVNDNQTNSNLDRIQANIYRIACCPDFSSDTFIGGVSSGIAIKYRLTGCETRAATIEVQMKKALQRRIEIICGFASMMIGEEVYRDIKINFERNIPEDISTLATAVSQLSGIVSDETLLSTLPFVNDPKTEAEKVREQKEASMAMYDFGMNNAVLDKENT